MSCGAEAARPRTAVAKAPSPVIQQYLELHAEVPDAILFFRMGDFYETFYRDAEICAEVLGITLTSRNKNDPEPIPMAGVPYHSAEGYIARLLEAGYSVAVCEQIGDPAKSKGPVERRIVRIATPGTAVDDAFLERGGEPWLWGWVEEGGQVGLAAVEFTTGRQGVAVLPRAEALERLRLGPVGEVVGSAETPPPRLEGLAVRTLAEARPAGPRTLPPLARRALGLVHAYLRETQRTELAHLRPPEPLVAPGRFALDPKTVRNLELFRNLWDGSRRGTLVGVIDRTVTAMGRRALAERLRAPCADPAVIDAWLDAVEALVGLPVAVEELTTALKGVPDLARAAARLSQRTASPPDLAVVRDALTVAGALAPQVEALEVPVFAKLVPRLRAGATIAERLAAELVDRPPRLVRDGGLFRTGVDPELDRLRELAEGGTRTLAELEVAERARTGIPSLKVGYNKVFGYYIEVSNAHRDKVPPEYHRRQTLTNAERYVTPELKELESRILSAREEAIAREDARWRELSEWVRGEASLLQEVAAALGEVDLVVGLARVALERGWTRPAVHDGLTTEIVGGRHPVLEAARDREFVPNDYRADADRRLAILTGPNMGGKSTYMRQNALIVLLAQIGSFVPAERATIGVVDQIFTRVGASDALWRGQSTFMVEMQEAAEILERATERSLVILDEIGRGTATFDGMSIAQAIAEHLLHEVRARTIFATHFHELAALGEEPGGCNLHVEVRLWEGKVIFLYTVAEGAASDSYGIQVAALAGLPRQVLERAETLLQQREGFAPAARASSEPAAPEASPRAAATPAQPSLFGEDVTAARLVQRLRKVDPLRTTPIEALELLAELKRMASEP